MQNWGQGYLCLLHVTCIVLFQCLIQHIFKVVSSQLVEYPRNASICNNLHLPGAYVC